MTPARQIQHLPAAEVFAALDSHPDGLSSAEVAERLFEVGPNSVEVRDRWRILRALLRQFVNFFALLLFVSAAACFCADALQPGENMDLLGWALLVVALLNAGFSFFQEHRAERAMEELRKYLPQQVEVLRDGSGRKVLAADLVPGDVLLLGEGQRISADARLVAAEGLLVNNAPLTGESTPRALQAEASDGRLAESDNLVLAGCTVLRGSGRAVIFATGLRTEFGKLAHLSQAIPRSPSPLEREVNHMVRILTAIAVAMGVAFFLYGVLSGRPLWVNMVFMMGIIVANVPEGLLPTLTLALAMGSQRMARKNVLITGLNAVESLGAVQVICTDKTGTLTQNRLSVSHLASADGGLLDHDAGQRLLRFACAAAALHRTEAGFGGDPLDVALAEGLVVADLPAPTAHVPFDAARRRAAGIAVVDGAPVFVVKGAWEALRALLTTVEGSAEQLPADAPRLERCEAAVQTLAADGLRVIAIAWRPLAAAEAGTPDPATLEHDLCLAGLVGIADTLRPEVPAAVQRCHEAGIDVLMITGDHPGTALAVARQCGIVAAADGAERLLGGGELERLTGPELVERLGAGVRVFARTTPEQKMKIVAALKALDRVVAMTGDGVNDAPALKAADVGVAMGASGTDVARATAQVILLDDNFASIVAGVEEGRTVFANIRKFTQYVLASNVPEIVPYLLYIVLPVPLALTVIQILFIDVGTDLLPAIALGQERPDPGIMRDPPRRVRGGLLTPGLLGTAYGFLGLLEACWSLGLFFAVLLAGGWSYGTPLAADDPLYRSATGLALAAVLLLQAPNLIGRRRLRSSGLDRSLFDNRLMLGGIALELLLSWGLLYWPPLQSVLGTGPVPWPFYLLAWCGIPVFFLLDWGRKRVRAAAMARLA